MKEKKNTTSAKPSTLTHVAIQSGFVSTKATTSAKSASLTDLYLSDFLVIESESAVLKDRTALLVTFADGINWPFRTKEASIDGVATTVIQVSSGWIKQHAPNLDDIKNAFRRFCENGHLVDATIQASFDSTFKRPGVTYHCGCGWHHTLSYTMRKEASEKKCPSCGALASTMTVVRN